MLNISLAASDKTLGQLVNDAMRFTAQRRVDQSPILAFFLSEVLGTSLHALFSTEGIARIRTEIFENEQHRDFMMQVTTNMLGLLCSSEEAWDDVLQLIVAAAGVTSVPEDTRESEYVLIPAVLYERVFVAEDMLGYLRANAWLAVLCLIHMYWDCTRLIAVAKEPGKAGTPPAVSA